MILLLAQNSLALAVHFWPVTYINKLDALCFLATCLSSFTVFRRCLTTFALQFFKLCQESLSTARSSKEAAYIFRHLSVAFRLSLKRSFGQPAGHFPSEISSYRFHVSSIHIYIYIYIYIYIERERERDSSIYIYRNIQIFRGVYTYI